MVKKFISFLSENQDTPRPNGLMRFNDFNKKDLNALEEYFPKESKDKKKLSELYSQYQEFKNEKSDFLRKEPKFIPLFFRIHVVDRTSLTDLEELYKTLQSHKNTIKQNNIDVTERRSYEDMIDLLDEVRLIEKTNKYVKLLPSALRSVIKNDKDYFNKFSEMIIDYNYDDYKNTFLKKVAKYKTPIEFFNALENHLSSFRGVSEIYKSIENDPNAEVFYSTEEFLIAMIFSKDASCNLGSQQWCISNNRYGNMWDSYIVSQRTGRSSPGVQYFVWDFRFPPTDVRSLIGVTYYNDGSITAHNKSDGSYSGEAKRQEWFKYLRPFKDLRLNDQVKMVSNNPEMEKYTNIISKLGEKEKRKYLQESPKLLLFFDDLSFLTNDEIWNLVSKDPSLGESKTIVEQLTDDQLFKMIIKRPSLTKHKFTNIENPYVKFIPKLNSEDKINIVVNDNSFYGTFVDGMTEDELLKIIEKDPNIMVETSSDIVRRVDQFKLKKLYLENKDKWKNIINNSSKRNDADKVQILLSHLSKSEERLKMEKETQLVVYGGLNEGNELDVMDGMLALTEDILNFPEELIGELLIDINLEGTHESRYSRIPKSILTDDIIKKKSNGDKYIQLVSSMDDLRGGNGEPTEQAIFDIIKDNFSAMG